MFYFITQFFRRSPATPANNATLPLSPSGAYTPGNLFASGDLMVNIVARWVRRSIDRSIVDIVGYVRVHQRGRNLSIRCKQTTNLADQSSEVRRLDFDGNIDEVHRVSSLWSRRATLNERISSHEDLCRTWKTTDLCISMWLWRDTDRRLIPTNVNLIPLNTLSGRANVGELRTRLIRSTI